MGFDHVFVENTLFSPSGPEQNTLFLQWLIYNFKAFLCFLSEFLVKNNVVRAKKITQIQIYRVFNFYKKIMGQVRNIILSICNWVKIMYDIVKRSFLAGFGAKVKWKKC